MSVDEIRELLNKHPFEPFRICVTSGDAYDIVDPNSVALGKSRLFIAFTNSVRWAACSYLHVAAIESLGNGRAAPRRQKRRR